jgi:methionyl-tRNA formyltransferase
MQPWPVAYTYWHHHGPSGAEAEPMRLIVHASRVIAGQGPPGTVLAALGDRLEVAAGEGAVQILTLQREGKKPGPVAEFLRGHPIHPGDRMGGPGPSCVGPSREPPRRVQ